MAYNKTVWQAEEGTNLNRFSKTNETVNDVNLVRNPGTITQVGTIFSTDNMNNIEDGIEENDKKLANIEATDKAGLTAIAEDQELYLDGSPSTITSDNRKSITDAGAFYIQPSINIDGVEYSNPSNIGGDDRGSYGFFPEWENAKWRDSGDWTLTNSTLDIVAGWLKLTTTAINGYANMILGSSVSNRRTGVLIKKIVGDVVYFGTTSTLASNSSYTFSTGTINNVGTNIIKAVQISSELAYIEYESQSVTTNSLIQLPGSGDSCYFKDYYSANDLEFIPPFGMDGNSKNTEEYYFDKWDSPISLDLKPQHDYDITSGTPFYLASFGGFASLSYDIPTDLFKVLIHTYTYNIGWDGANYDTSTPFTNNDDLQKKINIVIFADKDNDRVRIWFNGNLIHDDNTVDLSLWNPDERLSMRETGKSLLTNVCVHPKDIDFSTVFKAQYKKNNTTYGNKGQFSLDEFGNLTSANMAGRDEVVKTGQNINGYYRIYQDGYKECWLRGTKDNGLTSRQTFEFPLKFNSNVVVVINNADANSGSSCEYSRDYSLTEYGVQIYAQSGAAVSSARAFFMFAAGY